MLIDESPFPIAMGKGRGWGRMKHVRSSADASERDSTTARDTRYIAWAFAVQREGLQFLERSALVLA